MPGRSVSPMAQKSYDTHEFSESVALKEIMRTLELEGTLIQAVVLTHRQVILASASSSGRSWT